MKKLIFSATLVLPLLFFWTQETTHTFMATDLKHDIQGQLVEAFEKAKRSIEISIYSLNDPHVIQVLRKRAEEGLDVSVLLDHQSTPYAVKKLGPKVKATLIHPRGLMHHKIVVLDGKEVWLGSANFTTDSLKVHSNLVQRLFSESLADYIHLKLSSMHREGKKERFKSQTFEVCGQKLECWFLPDNSDASARILKLIDGAKKSIKVAMYTFTRQDFCESLIRKAEAGVKVEVIMDHGMCAGVSEKVAKAFEKTPVQIYQSEGNALLHNKMMIVDDAILEHGSANWTKAAFTQNEDYFIVLFDLTADQNKELNSLWQALLKRSNSPSSAMGKWVDWWNKWRTSATTK